ncbi:MAG: ABC transporter substrate-binding protein [Paracoccaceae bacterium]|nr:ABC transporter substrate-binding protein [Paracoccaceae bacterium]
MSLLAAMGSAASAELDKVTFQLDWLPGGDKAPIYVCIQEGICESHGLDVTINGGRGSSEAITFLATGQSDIGTGGIEALMAAVANDAVPVKAVASVYTRAPHAFYTLKSSGIDSLEMVEGKKVVTSPFTSSNVFLPLVLQEMDMSEDDIELIKADPGALGPMLMSGSAEVMIAWMTDVTRYTNQAEDAGHELNIMPWSTGGLDLYGLVLIASETFLDERPEVAQRFIDAYRESVAFTRDNPEAAAAAVVETVPELEMENVVGSVNDMLLLAFNEVTEADGQGALTPERLAQTWDWVAVAQGLDPAALDPEAIVDRSFLPDQGS